MTIENLKRITAQAIQSNFRVRNTRVYLGARQARVVEMRRRQIREWVAVLRVLKQPSLCELVAAQIGNIGPLMGHDLRNRVMLAVDQSFSNRG